MRLFMVCVCVLFVVLVACGDQDIDTNGTVSSSSVSSDSNFNSQITQLSQLDQPTPLEHPIVVGMSKTNYDGQYMVVETRYRATRGFSEQLALDPTTDVIWPGAIIKGSTIRSGEYVPIVGKRGPITISISLENISGDKYRTISEAKLSKIRQAIGSILAKKLSGATPARISFTIEEVHSEDQFKLALGVGFGSMFHTLQSQFDFNSKTTRSRVLVKFMQVYYTIDIDIPRFAADFFDSDASWDYLLAQMAGASPVYVSSVSYGRMAIFSFESTESIDKLKSAINYSCNGIVTDGGLSISQEHKQLLNGCTIKALILGGNGAEAVASVNGFEGLKSYISKGGNYSKLSPAAPLAYKLRYLSNNAIANIVLCSEYVVRNRIAVANRYKVIDLFLQCISEDDSGSEAEFYGSCVVTAFTPKEPILGYHDGVQADSCVWRMGSDGAWGLRKGEKRYFNRELLFMLEPHQIDSAQLKIGGWLKEDDTFGSDSLGTYYLTLPFKDIEEKIYYVEGFKDDGTKARFGFRIVKNP